MRRTMAAIITAGVALLLPATAGAITHTAHVEIPHGVTHSDPEHEVVVWTTAPADPDDDGCPEPRDVFDGPGCSPPPPPPAPEPAISQEPAYSDTAATTSSAAAPTSMIQCESGGDPQAVSPDGTYWGLYQFDAASWAANGGDPAAYGSADAATQAAVAANVTYDAWPSC